MTERDPLADLLRHHDGPVDPAPAFADRLEARLLAELGTAASVPATRSSGFAPVPVRGRLRRLDGPTPARRTRWYDVAAAAVLLVSLMGGALTQLGGRRGPIDTPTAVAAPRLLSATGEEPAVTDRGSAARDFAWPGPALSAKDLVERWSVDITSAGLEGERVRAAVVPFEDTVYVVTSTFDGVAPGQTIEARDLATGTVRWTAQTKNSSSQPVVSAEGVLVVAAEAEDSLEVNQARYALRMLDLRTGAERWAYQLAETTNWNFHPALVADGTAYYVDADGVAYAVDAATGAERWVSGAGRSVADYRHSACVAPVENCRLGASAYRDGVLYLVNPAAEVHALDAATGAGLWTTDVGTRYGLQRDAVELLASERGPVVTMAALGGESIEGGYGEIVGRRTTLLARDDGDEVWTRDDVADDWSAAADGERLFLHTGSAADGSLVLMALDLTTGETAWEHDGVVGTPLGVTSGTSPVLLWGSSPDGERMDAIVGLDPATGAEVWRMAIGDWFPVLPLAQDGTVLGRGDDGTLRAYRPASAQVAEAAVMEGGSPARDNRFAGPAPVAGRLEARWSAALMDGQAFPSVVPFGDLVYSVIPILSSDNRRVEARDVTGGGVRWSIEVGPVSSAPTVSEAGLLLLESYPATSKASARAQRLRMLDRETGEERWRYEIGPTTTTFRGPIVARGTVYDVDGNGVAYALDAATGAERWVTRAPRAFPASRSFDCGAPVAVCNWGSFAYEEGVLYLVNSAAEVYALDAGSGSTIWKVDVGERYGLERTSVTVTVLATGRGAVLNMTIAAEEPDASGILRPVGFRTALLDRGTGDEVWTRDDVADLMDASSDGKRLFVRELPPTADCCAVVALDLATGDTVWTLDTAEAPGPPLGVVGDQDPVLVRVYGRHEEQVFLVGLDPATGEERWRLETDQDYPMLPLAADGTLLTLESDGTLTAFRLVPDPAVDGTPVAVPVASPGPTPAGPGHEAPSTSNGFSPDHVVSAGQDVNLRSEPTAAGGATVRHRGGLGRDAAPGDRPDRAVGRPGQRPVA